MSLAVTGARLDGEVVGLRVEGRHASWRWARGSNSTPGDEVIDAGGMALVPGLVNGHTHAAMTLFRGHGDDLPLMEWLEEVIWPVEARLDDDDVYWGARLACVEMIRTGTVRFWDMYWHAGATARAVEDAGLRATIGAPLIDVGDRRRGGPASRRRGARPRGDRRAARADRAGARPARRSTRSASRRCDGSPRPPQKRELPVHIHLSETEEEVTRCVAAHGARPAEYLDRARAARAADAACPRGLAGRGRARADRCAGRHGGHQSGRQPEARGGSRLPLPRGARSTASRSASAPMGRDRTTRSTCSPT